MKIEELWEQILILEETDPPIRLLVDTELEISKIKSLLSMYKYRSLKADDGLKEVLGKFRLGFNYQQRGRDGKWVLSISVDYTSLRGGDKEIAATQLPPLANLGD